MGWKISTDVFPKDTPVNFIEFLFKIGDLLCQNHSFFRKQIRSILAVCGCFDFDHIEFTHFSTFTSLMDSESCCAKRMENISAHKEKNITFPDFINYCIKKKDYYQMILNYSCLKFSLQNFNQAREIMQNLFFNFRNRFLKFKKEIYPLLSQTNRAKIDNYIDKTLRACLSFNILSLLFHYRMLINKVDHLRMKELNSLPFPQNTTSDTVSIILDYFERTETSAFALFSL
jgi:hypothetical protein